MYSSETEEVYQPTIDYGLACGRTSRCGRSQTDLDEHLIGLVEQQNLLYDRSHPNYWCRSKRTAAWKMVGKSLQNVFGETGNVGERAKRRFNKLRSRFRTEYHKMKKNPNFATDWELYEAIKFLEIHTLSYKNHEIMDEVQENIEEPAIEEPVRGEPVEITFVDCLSQIENLKKDVKQWMRNWTSEKQLGFMQQVSTLANLYIARSRQN